MESLKDAVGLGDATTTNTTSQNETKGREPISGMTGAGTADQPYDAGNLDEESQLTDPKTDATTTESTDAAAPLKSLADDEPGAAPGGGILATLASAVGLGGSNTAADANADHQGQEPVSGVTGQGTADEPYDVGNEDDPSLGGKAHQQTSPSDGLQFIGGASSSRAAEPQTHTSITQAVNEGALGGAQDPAKSNDGLAFVSRGDKHPTEPLAPKTSNHEPVSGTSGAYTIGQPLAPGVAQQPSPAMPGPDATPDSELLNKNGENTSKTGSARISSLFSNPFAKRESISGASGEVDMDPKAKTVPGSEPIPELQDHAVPVKVAKEKHTLPTQASATPQSPVSKKPEAVVVEPKANGNVLPPNHLGPDVPPGAASPKRDKGKGKVYGDTDSNSTRSSLTRNESIATSQTGVSTRDSRRFSSHTPGKMPTAGGIVLGERASKDRERRASLAPSGHSAVTSEPQYGGRESLQKVTEDAVPAPAQTITVQDPPVTSPVQSGDSQQLPSPTPAQASSPPVQLANEAPTTSKKPTPDAPSSPTSSTRVPGTEKSTLSSPPQSTSRFSEQGIRDTPSPSSPDPTTSPTTTSERKPSLAARIGRKLSIKSSSSSSKSRGSGTGTGAAGAHPETIDEKK